MWMTCCYLGNAILAEYCYLHNHTCSRTIDSGAYLDYAFKGFCCCLSFWAFFDLVCRPESAHNPLSLAPFLEIRKCIAKNFKQVKVTVVE